MGKMKNSSTREKPRFTSRGSMRPEQLTLMSFTEFEELSSTLQDGREVEFLAPLSISPKLKDRPDSVLEPLMKVDVSSWPIVSKFMSEYGLVYSAARTNLVEGAKASPLPNVYSAWTDQRMTRPILRHFIYGDDVGDIEGEGISTSFTAVKNCCLDLTPRLAASVSKAEVIASITAVQKVSRVILDAMKIGNYPSPDDTDARERLTIACSYVDSALSCHLFALAPLDDHGELFVTPLVYALAELASIALDGEPLKRCKKCGSWFQYKKSVRDYAVQKKNEGKQRFERGATFCSTACQKEYNYEKLKAKRAAERAEKQGGAE